MMSTNSSATVARQGQIQNFIEDFVKQIQSVDAVASDAAAAAVNAPDSPASPKMSASAPISNASAIMDEASERAPRSATPTLAATPQPKAPSTSIFKALYVRSFRALAPGSHHLPTVRYVAANAGIDHLDDAALLALADDTRREHLATIQQRPTITSGTGSDSARDLSHDSDDEYQPMELANSSADSAVDLTVSSTSPPTLSAPWKPRRPTAAIYKRPRTPDVDRSTRYNSYLRGHSRARDSSPSSPYSTDFLAKKMDNFNLRERSRDTAELRPAFYYRCTLYTFNTRRVLPDHVCDPRSLCFSNARGLLTPLAQVLHNLQTEADYPHDWFRQLSSLLQFSFFRPFSIDLSTTFMTVLQKNPNIVLYRSISDLQQIGPMVLDGLQFLPVIYLSMNAAHLDDADGNDTVASKVNRLVLSFLMPRGPLHVILSKGDSSSALIPDFFASILRDPAVVKLGPALTTYAAPVLDTFGVNLTSCVNFSKFISHHGAKIYQLSPPRPDLPLSMPSVAELITGSSYAPAPGSYSPEDFEDNSDCLKALPLQRYIAEHQTAMLAVTKALVHSAQQASPRMAVARLFLSVVCPRDPNSFAFLSSGPSIAFVRAFFNPHAHSNLRRDLRHLTCKEANVLHNIFRKHNKTCA